MSVFAENKGEVKREAVCLQGCMAARNICV